MRPIHNVRKRFTQILSIYLILIFGANFAHSQNALTFEITELNPKLSGQVLINIFNQAKGFPDDPTQAFRTLVLPHNHETKLSYTLHHLPAGRYAVAVVHDANKNNTFDTNLFGYPEEGVGVSNNQLSTLSKPDFYSSSVEVFSPQKIQIRIKYY